MPVSEIDALPRGGAMVPRPTTAPCPTCGACLLVREWVGELAGHAACWREHHPGITPVLGQVHPCAAGGGQT